MTKEELFELTAIDPWWLAQLEELHTTEVRLVTVLYFVVFFRYFDRHVTARC
jgi:hypothetical protein